MALGNSGAPLRIRRQTWITRADLKANRDWIYVYGDNVKREGRRGLAREMRGEPNAHAISVSWGPFDPFLPETLQDAKREIAQDLAALAARKAAHIIWPMAGIVPEFLTMPDELYHFLRREARRLLQVADPA
ncbi:MAG: hypothetical protein NXH78_16020 [Hyphomonadaceae bacterium]|nr:hypothetical protein [Hyphomonadaceae bacterium]